MDLPTYTNIWRIEKRLYKLYDFRLPMPLPISWIAVFCGVTIPYVGVLAAIGVPFNHNLFFLYVLPPGVLTWLITRPVLENKRLPELLVSQLRYIGEPRTWCRLKPLSEKDGIRVYARVWHRAPTAAAEAAERSMALALAARAAGERAPTLPGRARPGGTPGPDRAPGAGRKAWRGGQDRPPLAPRPAHGPAAWPDAGLPAEQFRAGPRGVQVRDGARAGSAPVRVRAEQAGPYRAGSGWATPGRPGSPAEPGGLSPARRPAIPGRVLRDPADAAPAPRGPLPITPPPIEVSHETQGTQSPSAVPLWGRPSSRRRGPGAPGYRAVPGGQPHVLPPAGPSGPAREEASPPGTADVPAAPAPAAASPAPPAPAGPAPAAASPAPAAASPAPAVNVPAAAVDVPAVDVPAPAIQDALAPSTQDVPRAGIPDVFQDAPAPGTPPLPAASAEDAPAPRAPADAEDAPAPGTPPVLPASAGNAPASSTPDMAPASTRDLPAAAIPVVPEQPRRPVPSIERALSGPAADRIDSWQRRVRVVPGGQGPGKRDQQTLDRDRARLPLAGPRRIVFLGCTSGAGQTVTALMTGQLLAALRGVPVAAIDLNPGRGSLSRQAQSAPALTVAAFLEGSAPPGHPEPAPPGHPEPASPGYPGPAASDADPARPATGARFDVITSDADPGESAMAADRGYPRLAERAGRYYALTMLDPGAAEVTRVLGIADQLVLVAPASRDAPRSLAMTQEWLGVNGHGDLAARAVTVVNGVSKASMGEVEQAEAVARGRCRAIVRIPWDDILADGAPGVSALRPQARHAYTALAGVLVAGLAAAPVPRKVLH